MTHKKSRKKREKRSQVFFGAFRSVKVDLDRQQAFVQNKVENDPEQCNKFQRGAPRTFLINSE